ncbi:hypothetical protein A3F03_00330 [Candidatus Roizmanbacteria bacterium RIFCSPHIGHO2_12_FULL_41_11]|uniref:Uncharacterized protein n=2 Tax=Patescibacteria group TaxID=1783273 RepID=A0A1F8H930_9BACT|nr:MAG: hypothetical protein A3F03_00330 [Candidatus Roizmanbacteria bacterium RIFCSPHIGHO2_12_FULL_41_11]OGN34132.1 MAG: hypothetical protein A3I39_00380 [Candidatus Yanofskybacteria bacterium RIFCSPLOWO2_02_FULL_47_9b]
MVKNKMTIEDLAAMIERNIPTKDEINGKFNELRYELKGDLQTGIHSVKEEIREVKLELEEVHDIVDRIDGKDLPNLKRQTTVLETIVKPLRK